MIYTVCSVKINNYHVKASLITVEQRSSLSHTHTHTHTYSNESDNASTGMKIIFMNTNTMGNGTRKKNKKTMQRP